MKQRLTLFDTTLRDGAQTTGIDFQLEDKIKIAHILDDLGLDYIEGGYPGANPTDTEFFNQKRTRNAKFTGFGMTKRAGISAANDPGLTMLMQAKADAMCFVAKSWDYHVHVALGCTLDENIESISESVKTAKAKGFEPLVDCEHFFDGYKANHEYALKCAKTAFDSGARWVVLCDTNGGTMPHEASAIIADVIKHIPGANLGIHAHNDTEQAVSMSLAAVLAGVRQIQGTLNGIGERCGNANLTSIIPTLLLKEPFKSMFEIGVSLDKLTSLTAISRQFDELINRPPFKHAAYVGASAFATKAGIHASAVLKDPQTYEHVPPENTGNRRKVLVSEQGGKSNIIAELERLGVIIEKNDPRVTRILDEVKERETLGYAYEGADASFLLLARRIMGEVPDFFEIERFKVSVERRYNALGELVSFSEASVKLLIDGEHLLSVAEGVGPVAALDLALRKDLGKYQRYIEDLELVDFRVRILNGSTNAVTRVLIESRDAKGETWTTVGVSANIIDASFQALVDSITYKLLKEGAKA
jgi:2-isopropylmalate synthase